MDSEQQRDLGVSARPVLLPAPPPEPTVRRDRWLPYLADRVRVPRRLRRFRRDMKSSVTDGLVGFIEFSYQHYALGDSATTLINLATIAHEKRLRHIDLRLVVDPAEPASPIQPHIGPGNYMVHLDNLYPIFLCTPGLRSLRVLRDRRSFGHALMTSAMSRVPLWPSLPVQVARSIHYPLDHDRLNAFWARHGFLPRLRVPRGYETWVEHFLGEQREGRTIVVTSIRQSGRTEIAAELSRDAPIAEWIRFLSWASYRHPEILFVMVGGFAEMDHRVLALPNVLTARAHGLGLAHELAILLSADFFFGSSSGFSAVATFSEVPYTIVHVQNSFAEYAGVEVGAPTYPFALPNQNLTWTRENATSLVEDLEQLLAAAGGVEAP